MKLKLASLALALGTALLVAGCGEVACACIGNPPATPAPRFLGSSDNGKTISIRRGQSIELTLENSYGPPGSSLTWQASSSNPAVLSLLGTHIDPMSSPKLVQGRQVYRAVFLGAADGTAQIVGQGRRTCEAMNPAFCQQASYSVMVTVTG